jgi:hypothetical protein
LLVEVKTYEGKQRSVQLDEKAVISTCMQVLNAHVFQPTEEGFDALTMLPNKGFISGGMG